MIIKKVKIENYKCFKAFSIELDEGINILVGDNESGKSTILEAVHLALTGLLNGKYLKNELTQYLFNIDVVSDYVKSLKNGVPNPPPHILIEVFISGDDLAIFEGDGNSQKAKECGILLKIAFKEDYKSEYEQLVKNENIETIPIEYYEPVWKSFAREPITPRTIPIKSALIDSSSHRYQNGSDVYISRIIRENLESKEIVDISQAYRRMKETFMSEEAIKAINARIKSATKISEKDVKLSVDLSSKNAWETSLMTYLDDIPFHHIGKGEQCIVKTKLALCHKKVKEVNLILMEEPENHLSHSKLNQLIHNIKVDCEDKQILISTHSSFVANKLGLASLILLNNGETVRLKELSSETKRFFEKLSGYDTLRLILCKKAILVEGDSDELVVQKAYMTRNNNKLPIEDRIDVISVGTTFLRFLEIAEKLNKSVAVVTDNDGDVALKIMKKYEKYLNDNAKPNIKIFFDETEDCGDLEISGKKFNYNTLEPKLLKANGLKAINAILVKGYTEVDDLHKYMESKKTECALKIFDTKENVIFPQYILDAIE